MALPKTRKKLRRRAPTLAERAQAKLSQVKLRLRALRYTAVPGWSWITWPAVIWAVIALTVTVYVSQDRGPPLLPVTNLAEVDCLALNIYFEARSEANEGKRAVGHVVMNRVQDAAFPASICQVIREGGERANGSCQFSWWCDGRSDRPIDPLAWRESREIAWDILRGETSDPTSGALWYHADYVAPVWRTQLAKGRKIGSHIFYHRAQ